MPYAKMKNIMRMKDQAQFYLVKSSVPLHQKIVTIQKVTQMEWITEPLVWDLLMLKKTDDRDQIRENCILQWKGEEGGKTLFPISTFIPPVTIPE